MPDFSCSSCLPNHSGNPEEGSALYWAVRGGRYDMAALLVKHGADVSRVVPSQVVGLLFHLRVYHEFRSDMTPFLMDDVWPRLSTASTEWGVIVQGLLHTFDVSCV